MVVDTSIPHVLFHYDVKTDGDEPYQYYRLCFASPDIKEHISNYLEQYNLNKALMQEVSKLLENFGNRMWVRSPARFCGWYRVIDTQLFAGNPFKGTRTGLTRPMSSMSLS